jgi:MFS family permease
MSAKTEGIAPNASRLLWAGFMAILAAGVGFAIRNGILGTWEATFKFSGVEVGMIHGAGFTGFCFGIIIGGVIADKIGYGKLVIAAFTLHVLSAVVAVSVTDTMASKTAFSLLWTGTFLFACANGTLEAVANPLVATLYPNNRTHFLNILHASWPLGMVLGGLAGGFFGTTLKWSWQMQLMIFLVPTVIYGLMFLGQHMPKSEASAKGLTLGQMLKDVGVIGAAVIAFFVGLFVKDGLGPLLSGFTGSEFFGFTETAAGASVTWKYISIGVGAVVWLIFSGLSGFAMGSFLLFSLFVAHALVGAVELGTDGWIENINTIILTESQAKTLFIFTSLVMFGLRFCAHFIEKNMKMSPVGLLLTCALLACLGLNLASGIRTFGFAMGSLLVYAVGKTFFWPTMLAVASDRFPRAGAVAISIMGGIGMMSAGLIGAPGLGYAKDRFSAESVAPEIKAEAIGTKKSQWLFFEEVNKLDGDKVVAARKNFKAAREELAKSGQDDTEAALAKLSDKEHKLINADMDGARKTLKADSFIPIGMAVIYLLILLYFKAIGGYKPIHVDEQK